ncbi:MAG: 50S ribosomal protein L17 [Desulfuromonadales bacterium]
MRHRNSGKRLGRNTSHRKAMMRNMVTSLFEHEKISTTDARAKELRPMAEKLITLAKRGDLHARRLITEVVRDRKTVAKLFERIAPRFAERPGGYTRIIKLGHRLGDKAALSMITLVEEECTPKPKKKAPKAAATKKAVVAPAAVPAAEESVAAPVAEVAAPVAEPAEVEVAAPAAAAEGEQKDA